MEAMKENLALWVLAAFVLHPEMIVTHICLTASTDPRRCRSALRGIEKLFVFFFSKEMRCGSMGVCLYVRFKSEGGHGTPRQN